MSLKQRNQPYWEGKHFAFFQNKKCEYFPCHEDVDPHRHNCLFCFCPLYALGRGCGGNFQYTDRGYKDCSNCSIPHLPEKYGWIMEQYSLILEVIAREDAEIADPVCPEAM